VTTASIGGIHEFGGTIKDAEGTFQLT